MWWGSFGVGATFVIGGLTLWDVHPILAAILIGVGGLLTVWPTISEVVGLDTPIAMDWFRPFAVRHMAHLLRQAAKKERELETQRHTGNGSQTAGELATIYWGHLHVITFLELAFRHHVERDYKAYVEAERAKVGPGFSIHIATADYIEELAKRFRVSDLDKGFTTPRDFSQFDHASWPSNTRASSIPSELSNHLKWLALSALVILASALALWLITRRESNANAAVESVSMNCTPESLPLLGKVGESLYAVYLHPKWGDRIVSTSSTSWPIGAKPSTVAYRCEILNNGTRPLLGVSISFHATFSAHPDLPPTREIRIDVPTQLESQTPFVFHIMDDTDHAVEVIPSAEVTAKVLGETVARTMPISYSTRDGRPVRLRGFNP